MHSHIGLCLVAAALLGACSSGDGNGDQAQIRLLNVSTGYDSLDLYVNNNNNDDDDDSLKFEGVASDTVSAYTGLDSDTYTIKFKRNGVTSTLLTMSSEDLPDESHATYIGFGSVGNFAALPIDEDIAEPDPGDTKLSVFNTAESGPLDVYLTDPDTDLEDASPQFSAVDDGAGSGPVTIDSGSYRLRVTGAGDSEDVRLDLMDVSLESEQVLSLILTATPGGVLVNALFLPQQSDLSVSHNTKARIRGAIGVASTTAPVSVGVAGVTLLNSKVGAISPRYSLVESGTASVSLRVDNTPVPVSDQTLSAGADYTFLIWTDTSGVTQTSLISDDNRLPDTSGKAKIRLLNGMSGLAAPITLNIDFFPTIQGVELGQASPHTEVDVGADLPFEVNNSVDNASQLTKTFTLQAGDVYTLFMSGGGSTTVNNTLRKDR